ncbi:MAG: hypothetical protein Q9178_003243 [Gyalolechia marmorata]
MPQYLPNPLAQSLRFGFALALLMFCKIRMLAMFFLGTVAGAIAMRNESRQGQRRLSTDSTLQQPQTSRQGPQSVRILLASEEPHSIEIQPVDTGLGDYFSPTLPSIPEALEEQSGRSSPAPEMTHPIVENQPLNDEGKAPIRRISSEDDRVMNRLRELMEKRIDTLRLLPYEASSNEIRADDEEEFLSTTHAHNIPNTSPMIPAQAPGVESRNSASEATPPAIPMALKPSAPPAQAKLTQSQAPHVKKIPAAPEPEQEPESKGGSEIKELKNYG